MSRKDGYRLTTANRHEQPLSPGEYRQGRMEAAADRILEQNKANKAKRRNKPRKAKTGSLFEQKPRKPDNWADFDAIMDVNDQNHMNSIKAELRSAS